MRPLFAAALLLLFTQAHLGACRGGSQEPADPTVHVDPRQDGLEGAGTDDDPYRDLQAAIDAAPAGSTLLLRPGRYRAEGRDHIDPTCGNCGDPDYRAQIPVRVGFLVADKSLRLVGASPAETVLETGAGYGVLFENAGESGIEGLTVTGGVRGADGRSTDAGIVVRYTSLTVRNVDVRGNDDRYAGEPDPVVGIIGIAGREGARLAVVGSRILDNSWDGIALYRSDPAVADSAASAVLVGNEIGCTSDCVGRRGRGVGIGVTWDARAMIVNNLVHSYWKGVGSFGTAEVILTNSVIRDSHGWGVAASGASRMEATNNVIFRNGTAGLSGWSTTASGRFVNNIVAENGWNQNEWVGKRAGVWMNSPNIQFSYNALWANQVEDMCSGGVPGGDPCQPLPFAGQDGNLAVKPGFAEEVRFTLAPGSPLIDQGDPAILDPDGSRSDIGAHGGPDAGRTSL